MGNENGFISIRKEHFRAIAQSPEQGVFIGILKNGKIVSSRNSKDWIISTNIKNFRWRDAVWAPGLGLFIAISDSDTFNNVATSPDGVFWTLRTAPANKEWIKIDWYAKLTLLVLTAREDDYIATSPDGIMWTLYPKNSLEALI